MNKKIYHIVLLKYWLGVIICFSLSISPLIFSAYFHYKESLLSSMNFWLLSVTYFILFAVLLKKAFYEKNINGLNTDEHKKFIDSLVKKTGEKNLKQIKGIFQTEKLDSLATLNIIGFRKYIVLFLLSDEKLSSDEIYFMFMHELGHIKTNSLYFRYLLHNLRIFFIFLISFAILACLEKYGLCLDAFYHFIEIFDLIILLYCLLYFAKQLTSHQAEYMSDIIATTINKDYKTTVKTMRKFSKNSTKKEKPFLAYICSNHPPVEQRIKLILKIFA